MKSTKFQVFIKCKDREDNEIFRKIGDFTLNDDQVGFCLKLHENIGSKDASLKSDCVYPYAKKSVQGITILKILIQDTRLRRAPVIKKIEVWGSIARENLPAETALIQKLLKGVDQQQVPSSKPISSELDSSKFFRIPDSFLDSITQELLTMPFILPSGNIIDETTLEKHNKHEETYGRLPSDPFTGLIYTSDSYPRFDDALKVQLDNFKLRNSHELDVKKSGRTLGRVQTPVASTSSYAPSEHVSKKIKLSEGSSTDLDSLINSIYKNKQISIFTKPKESKTTESQLACKKCQNLSSSEIYKIKNCEHTFCKPCLLALGSFCAVCKKIFNSQDVVKINR